MSTESGLRHRSQSKGKDSDSDMPPLPLPPNIHSIARFTVGNTPTREGSLPPGVAIRLSSTPETRNSNPNTTPPTLSLDPPVLSLADPFGERPKKGSVRSRSRSRSRSQSVGQGSNESTSSLLPAGGASASHKALAHAHADVLAEEARMAWRNAKILLVIFICVVSSLFALYSCFPEMSPEEQAKLKFPRSIPELRDLSQVVLKYKDDHFFLVLAFYCMCYISLGSFAIPGSIFLSILAGPLFGLWLGLIIVSVVATTASSLCYLLSKTLAGVIVKRKFPTLIKAFDEKLAAHRDHLFYYLLFLRISPILPNWFISLSSPLLNIPLTTFASATFVGLMPGNYIHITTGLTLNTMTSDGPMINVKAILSLIGIACFALIPVLFKNRFEQLERTMAHNHPASGQNLSRDVPQEEERLITSHELDSPS